MKYFKWLKDNILFVITLFLLAFIPLYPKKPLLDIKNTWVYIRAEDFIVVLVMAFWIFLLIRKKITLRTPLTLPILFFWLAGAIATIHGVILIFPTIANVFPNVSFLSFLRHIEYMSLFFIAYSGMKHKRFLPIVITTLTITLLLVIGYGFGQKYLGFPAYLTMNEEFAKGIPIRLSALSRVPSTFAGHYDLAAYLVLIIPILASLIFGFRNWLIKISLLITIVLGFGLLFMTVSRVSFFVLFLALFIVLFFHKKRFVIFSIPIIAVLTFIFISLQPSLFDRFTSTVKDVDVLIDAKTGEALGHVKYLSAEQFKNKTIWQQDVRSKNEIAAIIGDEKDEVLEASPSALFPYENLTPEVPVFIATNISTGENLPQGTGYINLSLSPVTKKLGWFIYERQSNPEKSISEKVYALNGTFLIKRAAAYDLSFTTRFQGEWPNTIKAFKRNIFFGSGYGSVSLAVDNNYLRMLGEIGLLGLLSFIGIFVIIGIYIRKILPDVDSNLAKSFVIGFVAGVVGLFFNAFLIDVFEASKIAFSLWLLAGITVGLLDLYKKKDINLSQEFLHAITSPLAIIVYLITAVIVLYTPMISNYFIGDDFTWFRWADMGGNILTYFTQADGFFYRPGTKIYFYLMYSVFWLNQSVYHAVSLVLHCMIIIEFFLLAKKIFGRTLSASLAAFLFLIISGYFESIFWISSTGHLFSSVFILGSLLFYIVWEDNKKTLYFIASILSFICSLLFYELGIVTPLLILLYAAYKRETYNISFILKRIEYVFYIIPLIFYWLIRYAAQSHWLNGDYNYNIIKLPFNAIGNSIGYFSLTLFGPIVLPFYEKLRDFSKLHVGLTMIVVFSASVLVFFLYKTQRKKINKRDNSIFLFGFFFFVISLIPFLGLGNITSRYSYLASLGLIIILVLVLEKIYNLLSTSGKNIAFGSMVVVLMVFSLFHIMQIQQIHSDWYEAGQKVKRFFIVIDELYIDEWSREPLSLYFVNVPIRHGDAWVFPVGLKDALWFSFKNPQLSVNTTTSANDALNAAAHSVNPKVFEFNEDGTLVELTRVKGKIIKINR